MVSGIDIPTAVGSGDAFEWGGGVGAFFIEGTFDSATFALEYSPDDGSNYYAVIERNTASTAVSFTAKGYKTFELPKGKLRITRTSGTSPSGMSAFIGVCESQVRLY